MRNAGLILFFALLTGLVGRAQDSEGLIIDTVFHHADGAFTLDKGYFNKSGKKNGEWLRTIDDSISVRSIWRNGELRLLETYRPNHQSKSLHFSQVGEIKKVIERDYGTISYLEKCSFPGQRRSRIKKYHSNGKLKEKGREKTYTRVMGCLGWRPYKGRHGKWRYYDSKGNKIKVVSYKKGEIVKVKMVKD